MNKEKYKKSIDNLHISQDFNERTAKLMKETLTKTKRKSPMAKKLVLTFASAAIIISGSAIALNYNNLFPSKGGALDNTTDNVSILMGTTEQGITVPITTLPDSKTVGNVQADMIGLFVYQGRIYKQSNTAFETNSDYTINKADIMNLRGDKLGKTIGNINEWSKQKDYATEFASTIGEGDVYTVKGYDSKYRLMVYTEYQDGFNCELYDSFGGLTLTSGADYFDLLNLRDTIVSYQWESYDSWNNGKLERTDANNAFKINVFMEELYTSTPLGGMDDIFSENTDFDSQKFIYLKTKDNLITSIRLFKEGYVYAPGVGFFQVDKTAFDAFWNTMPVTAPSEVTETPPDTVSEASTIEVSLTPTSYPVGTDSITLKIKNNSADEFFYGVDYSIETFSGENWEVVPAAADLMFIEIAQSLGSNAEQDFVVDLSQLNPSLKAGTYRVVKTINNEQFYVEFELTN